MAHSAIGLAPVLGSVTITVVCMAFALFPMTSLALILNRIVLAFPVPNSNCVVKRPSLACRSPLRPSSASTPTVRFGFDSRICFTRRRFGARSPSASEMRTEIVTGCFPVPTVRVVGLTSRSERIGESAMASPGVRRTSVRTGNTMNLECEDAFGSDGALIVSAKFGNATMM